MRLERLTSTLARHCCPPSFPTATPPYLKVFYDEARASMTRLAFLKIGWAIGQRTRGVWREDGCSPALSHSGDLNSVLLILNRGFVWGVGDTHWHFPNPLAAAKPLSPL